MRRFLREESLTTGCGYQMLYLLVLAILAITEYHVSLWFGWCLTPWPWANWVLWWGGPALVVGFVAGWSRSLGGGPAVWLWLGLVLSAVPVTLAIATVVLFMQYSPLRETPVGTATAIPAVVAGCFVGCLLGQWARRFRTARAARGDPPPLGEAC